MTTDPTDAVLSRLDGARPCGADKRLARCPAHDDTRASLSVKRGADGRALLHCFAGCDAARPRDGELLRDGLRLFDRDLILVTIICRMVGAAMD